MHEEYYEACLNLFFNCFRVLNFFVCLCVCMCMYVCACVWSILASHDLEFGWKPFSLARSPCLLVVFHLVTFLCVILIHLNGFGALVSKSSIVIWEMSSLSVAHVVFQRYSSCYSIYCIDCKFYVILSAATLLSG